MLWELFLTVLIIPLTLVLTYVYLRKRNLGELSDITTASVAFDHEAFGHILNWDQHCFYLHGKPLWVISGEFHYWRLPDKNRWRTILLQYKTAGLNCIRVYFHWGFHSPAEGEYIFEDDRDVEYLFQLCEELELFVLCAPGPYICAETQGGGHPSWLIAKRHVRIRHSLVSFFRLYDQEYSNYCQEWFRNILPIIQRHQVTSKPKGCVLAVQIENETFELIFGIIPLGLSDDMRVLAKCARDLGITVPLFTNDAWEAGSFIAYPEGKKIFGKDHFGIDLYGFDKYSIFAPVSSPKAALLGIPPENSKWEEWDIKEFKASLDNIEKTVRGYGGAAAQSPLLIPELQGGWFNHHTVKSGYDTTYNYYGKKYTRLILDTVLSQGVTAFNLYMFYGGTNWGTVGDPDVYTSYDYSACIREYGLYCSKGNIHLSQGRHVRLVISFVRSFAAEFSRTECQDISIRAPFTITSSVDDYIAKQRRTIGLHKIYFIFFRNLNMKKPSASTITVNRNNREPLQLKSKLPFKQSFIGIADYKTKSGLHLILSTIPIYTRIFTKAGQEIWVVQCDDEINGQLAFYGKVACEGNLEPVALVELDATVISLKKSSGSCKITDEKGGSLVIVALTGYNLETLYPVFTEPYWGTFDTTVAAVFWGCHQFEFIIKDRILEVDAIENDKSVYGISGIDEFKNFVPTEKFGTEYVVEHPLNPIKQEDIELAHHLPDLEFTKKRTLDFTKIPWLKLELVKGKTYPLKNAIDYCFTSGHVLYKLEFNLSSIPSAPLTFDINMRHQCALYLNNKLFGGHLTYSLSLFRPGGKSGPDFGRFYGWESYDLHPNDLVRGKNEIICIVESLGMGRQPGPSNDIRTPRGILDAKIKSVKDIKWFIAGIDVRGTKNPFNLSGLPLDDEDTWTNLEKPLKNILPSNILVPTWFEGKFTASTKKDIIAPLRLIVRGTNMAYIFINGIFIARYYGSIGPQESFYIPCDMYNETNTIRVMTYSIEHQHQSGNLELSFNLWKIEDQDNAVTSGNLIETGKPFVLYSQTLKVQ
ncbi:hypothetical protein HDV01_003263 [Terramyces sp. JEL0728]|nr:hypothetical protein HDV01_003263 [Terramyces sp. JEL0728]